MNQTINTLRELQKELRYTISVLGKQEAKIRQIHSNFQQNRSSDANADKLFERLFQGIRQSLVENKTKLEETEKIVNHTLP